MNNIKRKEWLDTVRGIGVILVMLAHSCGIPLVGGGASCILYADVFCRNRLYL